MNGDFMGSRPAEEPRISQGAVVDISVIIPYGGGNKNSLLAQLDAVLVSTMEARKGGYSTEVVVAANSADAVEELRGIISEEPGGAGLVLVDATRLRGPSFARNEAVRASSGGMLLFCDADDVVSPGWAIALAQSLADADIAVGVRRHDLLNDLRSSRGWSNETAHLETVYHHLPFGTLSCLGMRRELFLRIGGCDTLLATGEDIDLCWRGQYVGGRIILNPNAIVQYRLRRGLRSQFVQAYHYGVGDARLVSKHRRYGARRMPRDSLRAIAGCASQSVKFMIGYRRPVASYVLGHSWGRIAGSVRYKVWVI